MENFSDIDIVARTLYGEARGDVSKVGIIALEAIAGVIWNRWKLNPKRFGETPRKVCLQPYQFSCWNSHDPNLPVLMSSLNDGTYTLCQMVANEFLSGKGVDVTYGANHYHSRWIYPPSWAKDVEPLIDIGNHRFYHIAA
jgi:spore germination cell wall hydrolase CwlJ-like protein